MAARINEFSYDGAAGEFVEIRVDAGEDVSDLYLEVYIKSGGLSITVDSSIAVSTGTFTTDGSYDYYVISTALQDGPRAAIALVDDGVVLESVAWGANSNFSANGGSLDGDTVASIGDPQSNSSTTTLSVDEENGGFVETPSTEGEDNVCFVHGAMIMTPLGERRVEHLRVGDMVCTQDSGPQAIRWIGLRRLTRRELIATPRIRPIRIAAGALGAGVPAQDLLVSPQHRVLLRSPIIARMFGSAEVLVPAKKLLGLKGVSVDTELTEVVYVHMLFDRHELVWSHGALTESLYVGPEARKAIPSEEIAELAFLFPELFQGDHQMPPARPFARRNGPVQSMIRRHEKNNKPLVCPVA